MVNSFIGDGVGMMGEYTVSGTIEPVPQLSRDGKDPRMVEEMRSLL